MPRGEAPHAHPVKRVADQGSDVSFGAGPATLFTPLWVSTCFGPSWQWSQGVGFGGMLVLSFFL